MRRYGYTFIKGSGADYKFSYLIEAIFFGGFIFIPLLALFNPHSSKDVFLSYLLLMFFYGLLAILAEMLPKTSLYLSLMFITSVFIWTIYATVKQALPDQFDEIFFYNIATQTLYYLGIVFVTLISIKKEKLGTSDSH